MSTAIAIPAPSPTLGLLHARDARAKLVAFLGLVVITVTVPATDHLALAGCGAWLVILTLIARVSLHEILHRFLHLAPFLAVAAILPFTHPAGGLALAIGMVLKAFIGCLALVLLAATTPVDRLLAGLVGLRCPAVIVLLLSMLTRYLYLLGDEARRMRRAATARGFAPRSLGQVTIIGHLIGALFLRSYGRAERVHAAMVARGFDGTTVVEAPEPMTVTDYLFMVLVLGVAITWRIAGP